MMEEFTKEHGRMGFWMDLALTKANTAFFKQSIITKMESVMKDDHAFIGYFT